MSALDSILAAFWRWIDVVAATILGALDSAATKRTVRLVEGEPGRFALYSSEKDAAPGDVTIEVENGSIAARSPAELDAALAGSRIEVLLRPERFVFKPLELPIRAAEFLDGVVRAQIDRLTPWSADAAAFGASSPNDGGSGRIVVTVAATAKAALLPLVKTLEGRGARLVRISAEPPDTAAGAAAIPVLEENIAGILNMHAARRMLAVGLAAAFLLSVGTGIAANFIDSSLQSRQDDLARQIAARRQAALSALNAPGDPKTLAERALAQRKNNTPSSVMALEILSQILPDHTYVTELRIEADKVRLTGVTHDAPGLIRLIEQTKHFSEAAFFAPVTHSSTDSGDRFNIEARMEPNFSLTP